MAQVFIDPSFMERVFKGEAKRLRALRRRRLEKSFLAKATFRVF